jgi:hypothetical protein
MIGRGELRSSGRGLLEAQVQERRPWRRARKMRKRQGVAKRERAQPFPVRQSMLHEGLT